MGNIFARREELLKEAEEIYREIFRESILCLEESYHTEGYKKSVTEAFAKAARMWKENYENEAASLGICSLYFKADICVSDCSFGRGILAGKGRSGTYVGAGRFTGIF